jgi:hypothetical protein
MQVTKRPLTGWEAKSTVTDRRHIQEVIDCLTPLSEVAVECQADAVAAVDALKNVLECVTPKDKPKPATTASTAPSTK